MWSSSMWCFTIFASPRSEEETIRKELKALSPEDLQSLAKSFGIQGNLSDEVLLDELLYMSKDALLEELKALSKSKKGATEESRNSFPLPSRVVSSSGSSKKKLIVAFTEEKEKERQSENFEYGDLYVSKEEESKKGAPTVFPSSSPLRAIMTHSPLLSPDDYSDTPAPDHDPGDGSERPRKPAGTKMRTRASSPDADVPSKPLVLARKNMQSMGGNQQDGAGKTVTFSPGSQSSKVRSKNSTLLLNPEGVNRSRKL